MDDPIRRETRGEQQEIVRRALALWPRLDVRLVRRCHGDPWRIAKLVSLRSPLPPETIVGMLRTTRLTVTRISVVEGETWFG